MKIFNKNSWIEFHRKDSEKAWDYFINQYDELILGVIHKLVDDYDESMEIYTYVLEQLNSNNCNKLTSYFTESRKYNFETWIAVVTRNCCFDWLRKEKGRKRLLKCIEELPEVDQNIFKHIYWQGHSYEEIFNILNNNHDYKISFEEMVSKIDKIEETLKQKTQWNISRNWSTILPPKPIESVEIGKEKVIENNPSPEEQFIKNNPYNILKKSMNNLSPQEQLIIQLHFYKDMSLNKIARILKMKNLWRVRRKLQKILKSLEKNLRKRGIDPSDINIS